MRLISQAFPRVFLTLLFFVSVAKAANEATVFDVTKYGARGDGKTDSTNAVLKAWEEACKWRGNARIYIPSGTFLVREARFMGPCEGYMSFVLKGDLKAPRNPFDIKSDTWITFRYVNRLTLTGGGTFDGQGEYAWRFNDCHKNPNCHTLAMTLGFQFIRDSTIQHIKSLNSKNAHFNFFACENVNVTQVTISAPGDSPNTDGIKIGSSNRINFLDCNIGTGDDCIAILTGNTDITVTGVSCGPGHGISVGSLGRNKDEKDVTRLAVSDCVFTGTSDGVRIKTWASPESKAVVSDFHFSDLQMVDVGNPIIIDQQYCPHPPCDQKSDSRVEIRNVTYSRIWGTSKSDIAVNFSCSRSVPCRDIVLKDISLVHRGRPGRARSFCSNIYGSSSGKQQPPPCL